MVKESLEDEAITINLNGNGRQERKKERKKGEKKEEEKNLVSKNSRKKKKKKKKKKKRKKKDSSNKQTKTARKDIQWLTFLTKTGRKVAGESSSRNSGAFNKRRRTATLPWR